MVCAGDLPRGLLADSVAVTPVLVHEMVHVTQPHAGRRGPLWPYGETHALADERKDSNKRV